MYCDHVTGPQTAMIAREVVEYIVSLVLQTDCPESYESCRSDDLKPIVAIFRDRSPFEPLLDDHYFFVLADIAAMTFANENDDDNYVLTAR